MRLRVLALSAISLVGCHLAHERDRDAGSEIDAAVVTAASCPMGPRATCVLDDQVVSLTSSACDASCVTLEIVGRDPFDPSTCSRTPHGTRVRFSRCAPGSDGTELHITRLDTGDMAGGVYPGSSTECGCRGSLGFASGATAVHRGVRTPGTAEDVLAFLGDGIHYRVEACAIGGCP